MDCASEEQLVRMKLQEADNISWLQFDLPNRRLDVFHSGSHQSISKVLESLDLGSVLIGTEEAKDGAADGESAGERKVLWQVLTINVSFFALELLTGIVSDSIGLVADSLDMLADAFVYGLAIFAVGGTVGRKKSIAKVSGYFQLVLAGVGFIEVIRRFLGYGDVPSFQIMIAVSTLALIGNAVALYLLQKSKNREAHMQASLIFTSNDVIINTGVIIAGVMVFLSGSKLPDLAVGTIVFLIVGRGALRILKVAK